MGLQKIPLSGYFSVSRLLVTLTYRQKHAEQTPTGRCYLLPIMDFTMTGIYIQLASCQPLLSPPINLYWEEGPVRRYISIPEEREYSDRGRPARVSTDGDYREGYGLGRLGMNGKKKGRSGATFRPFDRTFIRRMS
jgi:hypothetical protein